MPLSAARGSACTENGQRPVDEPHSIENKPDRVSRFRLTSTSDGVDSHSFFDKFQMVFLVGGESGAQASLTAVRTAREAGIECQRRRYGSACQDLKCLARRQVGQPGSCSAVDARSVNLPNGGCWQSIGHPETTPLRFRRRIGGTGAVRMAATRRRSRFLGNQGSTGPPAMAPRRLRKAGAPLPGTPGRRRPPAIPQDGRRAGLDGESYTASPRRADAVYTDRPRVTPYAGLRGLRTLLQQTPARLKRGEGLSADWPKDSGDLAVARGGGAARVC